jgi:hypothetical protein
MEFLIIIGIFFLVFGLSFLLLNIRHLVTGEQFRGTCATNNPMVKNKFGECTTCGAKVGDDCAMPEVKDGDDKLSVA